MDDGGRGVDEEGLTCVCGKSKPNIAEVELAALLGRAKGAAVGRRGGAVRWSEEKRRMPPKRTRNTSAMGPPAFRRIWRR